VGDTRESPALKIVELLAGLGAELSYHDPHVPALADFGMHSSSFDDALSGADLALIVTAHPGVDHEQIARRARLVVDLRGVTRHSGVAEVVRL
jgi:UDP-N-acetyl-D-glucosamine dehydrogenase